MSTGLDAVYEELKRLQLGGMERVFIQDSTLALLTPAKPPVAPAAATPAGATPAIDLQAAVQSGAKPEAAAPTRAPQKTAVAKRTALPEAPTITLPDGDASSRMQWLKEQVETAPVCREHLRTNEQIVFGQGAVDADIFYCGDAPGEEEAASGTPFVGKSGVLLSKILKAMGLDRESVYMTNIMKWRPEHHKPYGNRPPTQAEMDFCLPYLKAQIEIVQPKVIIGLGNATVPGLLGPNPNRKMAAIRGTWQSFEGTPLIFTFQPSYLLFNDTMKTKRMAWEDMLKAMEKIGLPISEKQHSYFLPK
jgi:uracil-DNA glycosylase family 4